MKTQFELAKEIATKAHEGVFRWDGKTPYIAHPAAVVQAVFKRMQSQYSDLYRTAAMAAAWLHDVIEDTPLTATDLLIAGVDEDIVVVVDLLTKRDDQDYLAYLLRLKQNEMARIVKIEDIKNNMSDLDKKRKKSMYEKYQLALYILGG
jgi:(p)ppGpp synthase/HD superfamily hydrolase